MTEVENLCTINLSVDDFLDTSRQASFEDLGGPAGIHPKGGGGGNLARGSATLNGSLFQEKQSIWAKGSKSIG